MKYSEYHSKSKFTGSAAFYIIIACCLIAIGGAAWFAAANINKHGDSPKDESGSSYSSHNSPYESSGSMPNPSNPVTSQEAGKAVSDEPYSSKEETSESKDNPATAVIFSMPVQGEIIKGYSEKELQYSATLGDMRIHSGIDIACEDGTSVSAAGDGKVLSVDESGALGTSVTLDHGNGITTKYAALKGVKVKSGEKVSAGDIIGTVTTVPSECADQSHLHFEVCKNGHSADPLYTLGLE